MEESSDVCVDEYSSLNREESITGDALPTTAYASISIESAKVTNGRNCSVLRYSVYGVERKNVFPYELSDAVLDEKVMEKKESVIVDSEVSVERLRYIPPPLIA